MKYWLLKTEPEDWSWNQQVKLGKKGGEWNGVRNFQAAKNLKSMRWGDKCFFYHTGKQKKIVGIVKVIKEHFKDKLDKTNKFVSIIVKAEDKLTKSVTLKEIKNDNTSFYKLNIGLEADLYDNWEIKFSYDYYEEMTSENNRENQIQFTVVKKLMN